MNATRDATPATESIALRAFAVLEQIARSQDPMSLDEVAQATGLPKPTAFRILGLLQSASLLRREPLTRRYAVGPRLTALAVHLWHHGNLRALWRQALQEAVDAIGETCNLTILDGDKVLYLERVETPHHLRLHLEPGTRVPLHCTASGKLFLCQLDSRQLRRLLGPGPLPRHTPTTITDLDVLQRELANVRRTRVGTHDAELFEDSVAIAVPITDADGRIHAAVAVHAPSSRMTLEGCMQHLDTLRRTAAKIGTTLLPADSSATSRTAAEEATARSEGRRRSGSAPAAADT
ncbi:MAG TPA: IclR family transcriptional regulator [Burkholderiaceae bacterium]|jgi:IclR family transcriptional regulator, acetate operon repressor|nr:IclR family transcriptional regulator [Burkholderiaceae bacterium]